MVNFKGCNLVIAEVVKSEWRLAFRLSLDANYQPVFEWAKTKTTCTCT